MSLSQLRRMFSAPAPAPLSFAPRMYHVPDGTRVYAVGDIHGRHHLVEKMLEAIVQDAKAKPPARNIEVFLGDYVDRGLHSREVLDLLIAPPAAGHERVCLMGNHEDALLKFLDHPKYLRGWGNMGGYATLASYGLAIPESMAPERLAQLRDQFRRHMPTEHLAFLKSLPMQHIIGDYIFVHAGIAPGVAIAEQTRDNLLWIRNPFLNYEGHFEYYVVHGHSPIAAPEIHKNRANLDVSDATIPTLCCAVLDGTKRSIIMVTNENVDFAP